MLFRLCHVCTGMHLPCPEHVQTEQANTPQQLSDSYRLAAGDQRQLMAAAEMHARGWFWHRSLQQWMKRVSTSPTRTAQGQPAEVGTFTVWDTGQWAERSESEFMLEHSQVEDAPRVPDDTSVPQ